MKKSRFTETQIVAIFKEADAGMKMADMCRKHGISQPAYYNWKSKYGGMSASELKCIKELEAEHSKLKRMDADLAIEIDSSLPAERVIRVLEQIKDSRALPEQIRVDNGPEDHLLQRGAPSRGPR